MTGIRHTETFSSQFLGNPGIGVYLDGNSEVILAADCLGDEYRPIPFLWWGLEIPTDLEVLYTDSKSRPMVVSGVGWRTGMLLSVGRSWWVALKEGFIHTTSATGGAWPRCGHLVAVT